LRINTIKIGIKSNNELACPPLLEINILGKIVKYFINKGVTVRIYGKIAIYCPYIMDSFPYILISNKKYGKNMVKCSIYHGISLILWKTKENLAPILGAGASFINSVIYLIEP